MPRDQRVLRALATEKPNQWAPMLRLSGARQERLKEQLQVKLEEARNHLRFCMRLYKKQADAGRLFLHEHPAYATSWKMPEVEKVMKMNGVNSGV